MSAPAGLVSILEVLEWVNVSEKCTCKSLLATGDDDRADVLVIVVLAQGVVQLGKERTAKSVESLGAVQSD